MKIFISKDTEEKVKKLFKKRFELSKKAKENLEKVWWRNLLYYSGQQWIKWDRTRWRAKQLDPRIPKPVTNKFASSADAIGAALSKIIPLFTYTPVGTDRQARATASVCHQITPIIYEETEIEKHRAMLAMISVITGNGFLQTGYDTSDASLGTTKYSLGVCSSCGEKFKDATQRVCEKCGEGLIEEKEEEMPVGRCYTEVMLPFECFPNPYHRRIKEWFIKGKIYSEEWIKETFPDAEVKTTESIITDTSLRYTAELMTLSPLVGDNRNSKTIEGTALWEMWQEPSKDFPDGFYMAMLNDEIVEWFEELPDKNGKGTGFIPFVRFGFKPQIGSFWHKSGVDDIAPKQKQRNELESLIQLIYMTSANPVWLKPQGCNVSKITGLPGDQIEYSPLAQAKPERIDGKAPSPMLIKWIEQIDRDFDELAATFDIMRGEKPSGVRAGYALQVLTERAMARYAPIYREWENAWEEWNKQMLDHFRANATEPRVQTVLSKTSEWEASEFSSSDIQGDVSISVEAGTGAPKSQLLERMYIKEIMEMGLINIQDPREKMLILEKYGMKHLATVLDKDVKDSLEEEALFEKLQKPDGLRFSDMLDNHTVHFAFHRDYIKGDKFNKMPPELQKAFLEHARQHYEMMMREKMMQMGGEQPSAREPGSTGDPTPRNEGGM